MGYKWNPFTGNFDRVEAGTSSADIETLTGNSGGAVGPDGAFNVDVLGDNAQGIDIVGSPGTFTLTVSGIDATETQIGVSELATDGEAIAGTDAVRTIVPTSLKAKLGAQTPNSMPFGQGDTLSIGWSSALTDGQLMIGGTGIAPAAANLTSIGGSVIITDGPNTINLETGAAVATTFTCDTGSAVPALGILTITGATHVAGNTPLVTSGSGSTVTIDAQISQALGGTDSTAIGMCNFDSSIFTVDANGFVEISGTALAQTITGDTGGALSPTASNWNILGGTVAAGSTPVATSGAGSTLTANIQISQAVAAADATAIGLSNFNSANFSVDADGFVSLSGGGLTWIDEGTGITLSINTGYFITAAVTETMPASPAQGDVVKIICDHAGPVIITANAGQTISLGNVSSSTAGTFTNTAIGDSLDLVYRAASAEWKALNSVGNWSIA